MTQSTDPALARLLACPRCDKPLADGDALRCHPCNVDYPHLLDVPWLFAEPAAAFAQWRARMDFLLKHQAEAAAAIERALRRGALPPLTRQRLDLLRTAQLAHVEELNRLLAPLQIGTPGAAVATHLALRTRLPPTQGLTSYYSNLHRDWCWGDEENRASFQLVADALGPCDAQTLLVLGSGGGRLAYDVHMGIAPAHTVALDINPLLVLAARQVMRGEVLTLHEFPLAPRRLADVAVARKLAAPAAITPGFFNVLGDGLRAPFAAQAFDAVLTPWFVDIVAEDPAVLARRINALLRPGGRWVIFGSLALTGADPAQRLSIEELAATIADAGFAEPAVVEASLPYMSSPVSRHGRREGVITLTAVKRKRIAQPARHSALPEWLVQAKQSVPLLPGFQTQAATTRIYAFIMGMIDGQRSVTDMAVLMEQQRLMPRVEAEIAIRDFLIKMYDESQAAAGL